MFLFWDMLFHYQPLLYRNVTENLTMLEEKSKQEASKLQGQIAQLEEKVKSMHPCSRRQLNCCSLHVELMGQISLSITWHDKKIIVHTCIDCNIHS